MWKTTIIAIAAILSLIPEAFGVWKLKYMCAKNSTGFTAGCKAAECPILTQDPCYCSTITFNIAVDYCKTDSHYSCDPDNCVTKQSGYEIYNGTCTGTRVCAWDGTPKDIGIGQFCCTGYTP